MDIFRITAFLFLTAIVVSGCGEDPIECEPGSICGDAVAPSNITPAPAALAITAPADVQLEATGTITMVTLGQASATGGVVPYSYSHDAPANGFPLGTMTVTWTVTDGAGAQANDTQAITVADTTAPTLTAPPDLQVTSTGTNTPVNLGAATITDLVDPNPTIT